MTHGQTAIRILTLCLVAAVGSLGGIVVGLPVPLLTGPALLSAAVSLAGLPVSFPIPFRNLVFLLAGITIGAGVSRESLAALAAWPLAFAILCGAVCIMLVAGQMVVRPILKTGRAAALLAMTPGHLSYVIALSEEAGLNSRQISIVQSVRLLSLTMFVPFAARALGIEPGIGIAAGPVAMGPLATVVAVVAAFLLNPVLRRLHLPAPMLMAGMIVGAVGRVSGLADGGLAHVISYPTLALIGALIGSRFVGLTLADLRRSGLAGLAATAIAASCALLAAVLAAPIVDMPLAHVLVAFSPGGLETMAVLGAAIGANPGFVAAAHVLRLVFLSTVVPLLLARARRIDRIDRV